MVEINIIVDSEESLSVVDIVTQEGCASIERTDVRSNEAVSLTGIVTIAIVVGAGIVLVDWLAQVCQQLVKRFRPFTVIDLTGPTLTIDQTRRPVGMRGGVLIVYMDEHGKRATLEWNAESSNTSLESTLSTLKQLTQ